MKFLAPRTSKSLEFIRSGEKLPTQIDWKSILAQVFELSEEISNEDDFTLKKSLVGLIFFFFI